MIRDTKGVIRVEEHGEREQQKQAGWALVSDTSKPVAERARGFLMVLEAHYYRSDEAFGRRKGHPAFADYVAMRLYHKDCLKETDIYEYLVSRFGKRPGMKAGSSYYEGKRGV